MSDANNRRSSKKRPSMVAREGTGNVYADLGVPESAEALAKSEIAVRIATIIERRGLTQAKAASLLAVSQADVSDLMRGKLKGFSTERLFRFLNAFGQDVEIVILERRRSAARRGSVRVVDEHARAAVGGSRSRR